MTLNQETYTINTKKTPVHVMIMIGEIIGRVCIAWMALISYLYVTMELDATPSIMITRVIGIALLFLD